MSLSTLALAWLLSQSPAPADLVPMNRRNFSIPIQLNDPSRRTQIKQLILFVSDDEGKTWNQVSSSTPDKAAFPFNAPHDGLYWFSVGIVDSQGKQVPSSPYDAPPAQKVLVDTERPNFRTFTVDRQGDEIVVTWDIQEEHADMASLRLEYRPSDAASFEPWSMVPLNAAALRGEKRFAMKSQTGVSVRMELKDQVGNLGSSAQRDLPPGATPLTTAQSSPAPVPITGGTGSGTPTALPTPTTLAPASNFTGTSTSVAERPPAAQPSPVGRTDSFPATERPPTFAPPPTGYPIPNYSSDGMRTIAYSPETSGRMPAAVPVPGAPAPNYAPLPPLQVVNDPQISLEYEVGQFGPSGIGKVELWISKDDGRTWQYLTDDPDFKSPIIATLPGEGVYGLRLVIQSGAGLTKGPPLAGELPELRIEVDTTMPSVKLFEPRPDPAKRDTLVISWSAADRNLSPKPITLEYAERTEGPWLPIAADLPNTGSFSWQLPPKLPYRVYLRASAVDTAGNRSTAETCDPILVDLNKPVGRLLGIAPSVRRP
ncbi:MAG: hypothetical protein K2R98_21695 [Gemmataceae bacterium]|nr:hypothetical protein [Gemmataceae bacterium]